MSKRTETDSLGPVEIPTEALYGAQTQRAADNFPISGRGLPRRFVQALGQVKLAAAHTNHALGELDDEQHRVIVQAAAEVSRGDHDEHFPVDVYQTGSGTSTNMNANEVIANRALQLLGEPLGSKRLHPNDHVNRSQSSNDVIPTALHVSAAVALDESLIPALRHLAEALDEKATEWMNVVKSGRTHLMDATPIRLGQEVSGWAQQVHNGVRRAEAARDALLELALGGTAVGTGLNRPAEFPEKAIAWLASETGLPFRRATNPFEAQAARDAAVEAHGQLATIAASLNKIANDVRWMGSGPRAGFGELHLPATQPGSSIMPGKVNPVMSEMLTMVAARVMGNQGTVQICGMNGNFELNVYMPLLADVLLQSITLLANGSRTFADRCIVGMKANIEALEASVSRNLSLGTALAPAIGYDAAAKLAKEALATGRTIREVALATDALPEDELDRLLDPVQMT